MFQELLNQWSDYCRLHELTPDAWEDNDDNNDSSLIYIDDNETQVKSKVPKEDIQNDKKDGKALRSAHECKHCNKKGHWDDEYFALAKSADKRPDWFKEKLDEGKIQEVNAIKFLDDFDYSLSCDTNISENGRSDDSFGGTGD